MANKTKVMDAFGIQITHKDIADILGEGRTAKTVATSIVTVFNGSAEKFLIRNGIDNEMQLRSAMDDLESRRMENKEKIKALHEALEEAKHEADVEACIDKCIEEFKEEPTMVYHVTEQPVDQIVDSEVKHIAVPVDPDKLKLRKLNAIIDNVLLDTELRSIDEVAFNHMADELMELRRECFMHLVRVDWKAVAE